MAMVGVPKFTAAHITDGGVHTHGLFGSADHTTPSRRTAATAAAHPRFVPNEEWVRAIHRPTLHHSTLVLNGTGLWLLPRSGRCVPATPASANDHAAAASVVGPCGKDLC